MKNWYLLCIRTCVFLCELILQTVRIWLITYAPMCAFTFVYEKLLILKISYFSNSYNFSVFEFYGDLLIREKKNLESER